MKNIKKLLLMSVMALLMTGCVKFNATMNIKKDKSMDFSIIYAIDTSVFGEQTVLEESEKRELETQGFVVSDYSQDNMKGFTVSKKIENIDDVSTSNDAKYTLSGILDENSEDKYIFQVKKGLLKNTYTAKLVFDAADSDFNNSIDDSSDNDWNLNDDDATDWNDGEEGDLDFWDNEDNMDFSSMMANLDLSFNVTLPYPAKTHNASTTNDDGKKLNWNLSSQEAEEVNFEFELYNMTTIYTGIGVIIVLILIVVCIIIAKNKKGDSANSGRQAVTDGAGSQSVTSNAENNKSAQELFQLNEHSLVEQNARAASQPIQPQATSTEIIEQFVQSEDSVQDEKNEDIEQFVQPELNTIPQNNGQNIQPVQHPTVAEQQNNAAKIDPFNIGM